MKCLLNGGPFSGEETETGDPPMPWIKVMVDACPVPTWESIRNPDFSIRIIPIANYRLFRYDDGRLRYEYAGMD